MEEDPEEVSPSSGPHIRTALGRNIHNFLFFEESNHHISATTTTNGASSSPLSSATDRQKVTRGEMIKQRVVETFLKVKKPLFQLLYSKEIMINNYFVNN